MITNNFTLVGFYLVYLLSAFSLGNLFFTKILKNFYFGNKIEERVFEFGVGNILLSLLFLYFGIFGILTGPIVILSYLIPAFLFIIIKNKRLVVGFGKVLKKLGLFVKKEWWLIAFLLFTFYPIIPYLFLFPASWDPLAYHLTLPKIYIGQHSFPYFNWFPETAYPIGIESLFGFGEALGDARISNLIVFTFLVVTVIYITFGLRYRFDKKVLALAALIFLYKPILYTEVVFSPFVDYPFAFFGLLIAITLLKFIKKRKPEILAFLGMLIFFSFLVKYSGALIILATVTVLFVYFLANKIKITLKPINVNKLLLIVISASSLIPSIFWLVRNYIYAGNPIFPYLNSVFLADKIFEGDKGVIASIREVNALWRNSLDRILKHLDNVDDFTIIGERIFYYVLILVLGLGIFQKKKEIRYLSIFSLIILLSIGLLVGPLTRYYLPILPAAAIIFGYLFFIFFSKINLLKVAVLLLMIFSGLIQIDVTLFRMGLIFSNKSKSEWVSYFSYKKAQRLLEIQDNWKAIDYVNKNLDLQKDKLLVAFDNRLYYYKVPVVYVHPWAFFTKGSYQTSEGIYLTFKEMGATYFLESRSFGIPPGLDIDLYDSFKEKYLTTLHSPSLTTTLYKLK